MNTNLASRTALGVSIALLVMAAATHVVAAPKPTKLVFQIHEVKCWDETTGKYREKFGVDTMRLAAITIDPTGVVNRTQIMKLGEFASDGVLKQFDPPRVLTTFAMRNRPPFPIQYQTLLVLAEKDPGGGFDAQLNKLVKQGNAAALAKAKSLGANTLSSVEDALTSGNITPWSFAEEVGKEVLTAEATKAWKDDVFSLRPQSLSVAKENFSWSGKDQSPKIRVIFKGNQGKYHVVYSWKLK